MKRVKGNDKLRKHIEFKTILLREIRKVDAKVLRPTEKAVLCHLVSAWLSKKRSEKVLLLSRSDLAKKRKMSESAAKKALCRLEHFGLVSSDGDRVLAGKCIGKVVHIDRINTFIQVVEDNEINDADKRKKHGGNRCKTGGESAVEDSSTRVNFEQVYPGKLDFPIYKVLARTLIDIQSMEMECQKQALADRWHDTLLVTAKTDQVLP